MTSTPGCRTARTALWLSLLLLVGGCGVGETFTPGFAYDAIGPEGGQVAAGDVTVTFPPGALDNLTGVQVLPQADALEIDSGPGPCPINYLGPIWCCGPVGLDVAPSASLTILYNPALIPAGTPETNLVLLLWDEEAQAMLPIVSGVEQDLNAHAFITADYHQLGHIAVGVRTCLFDPDIVFLGFQSFVIGQKPVSGSTLGTTPEGLYLVQPDGSGLTYLPTGASGELPDAFIPSPDRQHVLWSYFPIGAESPDLRTLLIGDAAPNTVVQGHTSVKYDPFYGWKRADGNVYFHEYLSPPSAPLHGLYADTVYGEVVSTVPPDASALPASFHGYPSGYYPWDYRQSDDGSHFLTRLGDFISQGPDQLEVWLVDGTTVSFGIVPVGGGAQTPRFLPGSDDVYGVSLDFQSVFHAQPDGTGLPDLYTLPLNDGSLLDFVVAPDGDHFAALVRRFDVAQDTDIDWIDVGTLSPTPVVTGSTSLGRTTFTREMIFHPDSQRVFIDFGGFVGSYGVPDAAAGPGFPVAGMYNLDINRTDGRLLLLVSYRIITEGLVAGLLPPGLYVADPDGSNMTLVPTPVDLSVGSARWRSGIRAAPGMFGDSRVR